MKDDYSDENQLVLITFIKNIDHVTYIQIFKKYSLQYFIFHLKEGHFVHYFLIFSCIILLSIDKE